MVCQQQTRTSSIKYQLSLEEIIKNEHCWIFLIHGKSLITFSIRDCDRFDTDSIDMKKEKLKI